MNRRFGLSELGVLDGPPLRGAKTVTLLVATVLQVPLSVLIFFDDLSASLAIHTATCPVQARSSLPLSGSLSSSVRQANATVAIPDVAQTMPYAVERKHLRTGAFLGAPVYGPDRAPIGVLAAIGFARRGWAKSEIVKIEDLAHLVSQEILLRASFETLRIMAKEKGPLKS